MAFDPDIHNRRSIRLHNYDYTKAGAYFVTICAWRRECLFGEIVDGEMVLNELGSIARTAWAGLSNHYKHVELDIFVLMPNHLHGLIVFCENETHQERHGLSEVVRGFKTFSSRRINATRKNIGCPVWQRGYYERIIRDENELNRARSYIENNLLKWELDRENPLISR